MNKVVFSFGEFRLKRSERELWKRNELRVVPRVVFDCVTYLVEHRDRAVGRDELVAAVWGKADISEGHLNQIVVRARRALGDNAQAQQLIRTVPGFGYRWVGTVVEAIVADAPGVEAAQPQTAALQVHASTAAGDGVIAVNVVAKPVAWARRRAWMLAVALLLLTAAAVLVAVAYRPSSVPVVSTRASDGHSVAVLPVSVEASAESAWVGLGLMDLVAGRLRGTGLPVPTSEAVLLAVQDTATPPAPDALRRLRETLGADMLVQGTAIESGGVWTVRLLANGDADERHRIEARNADVIVAGRAAADLLLAALGRTPPPAVGGDPVQARLQQAQAASLANQLDVAHAILAAIPPSPGTDAEVRFRLVEVDFRAGRLDQAGDALAALLQDPHVQASTLLRARILALRGKLHFRRSAFIPARDDFDAAIAALRTVSAPLDLGDTLTRRGNVRGVSHDPDGALADFGEARLLMEQAGDRLQIAHVDAGFGMLLINQDRLELGLPHLQAAIDQYEAFGAIERVVTLLNVLNDVQTALLRWPAVATLVERQWALRERIVDPGLALVVANRRGRLLLALGRQREASEVLAEAQERFAGIRPEARRYLHDLEAELAWNLGQPARASAAVDRALETWPRDPTYERYAYLVLLRQRALIAAGTATPALIEPLLPVATDDDASALFLVARAEWAAHSNDDEQAQHYFEQALARVEAEGAPARVAQVAQAYAPWLLARGRLEPATALAGRLAVWAPGDFGCALLRVTVFHALGLHGTWATALEQARNLAGERVIPAALLVPPAEA